MATHFFGIRDRIYSYRNCIGRVAVNGEGFLCPVDVALGANDVGYVVNPLIRIPSRRAADHEMLA